MALKEFHLYLNDGSSDLPYLGVCKLRIPVTAKTLAEVQSVVQWTTDGSSTQWSAERLQTAFDYMNLYDMVPIVPNFVTYTTGETTYRVNPKTHESYEMLSTTMLAIGMGDSPEVNGNLSVEYKLCADFGVTDKNYYTLVFDWSYTSTCKITNVNNEGVVTNFASANRVLMVGFSCGVIGESSNSTCGLTCVTNDNKMFSTKFWGTSFASNIQYKTFTESETQAFMTLMDRAHDAPLDPYAPGGTSGPGHGEGTFDFESDPISFQPPPVLGALNSGFVTLYRPEMSDIQNLARYMWAGAFDVNNFKKLFADPMDAILGLSIVPLVKAQLQCVQDEIYVGNLSTGVQCDRIGKQYVTISCGSLTIPETWGAYLDYSPYTKMQLFLPYIGMVEINPDDCMRGVLTVQYNIDVYSGACNAQVYCWTQDDMYNGHVLYEFSGNCASWYPITAGQYQNFLISGYNILTGVGMGLSQVASGIEGLTGGEGKTGLGRSIGQMIAGSAASAEAIYSNVRASIKPQIQRTGGAGGSANLMGHQKPFLILTIPRMIIPGEQNAFIGYPSYVTMDLDDLNGFTIVDSIHIHGIPCTENEEAEILSLLKEGVFM